VTHTIGGIAVDTQARVAGTDGIWAAGVDAGGIASGGYASGLAQALVLGLAAADSIAGTA
jgi:fumarate reductase flavoprotein subunit